MKTRGHILKGSSGFSLLEVMITLSILVTLIITVSELLRRTVDMKIALSEKDGVTQKLNRIMEKITYDISHAYLLSSKDHTLTGGKKNTIFKIEKADKGDTLSMTYTGHKPIKSNSPESSLSYVVYELAESKKHPGRKNLYRGEFPRIPEDFKENPKMELFAENVSKLILEAWNGDDWTKDGWDSTKSDMENLLPHMVRIRVAVWSEEASEGESSEDIDDAPLDQYATIVYLPNALDFNEIKERTSSFRL